MPELSGLLRLSGNELEEALAERFSLRPLSERRDALTNGSSVVVPLATLSKICDTSLQIESEEDINLFGYTLRMARHDRHSMGQWCDLAAPNAVQPRRGKASMPAPMPQYGCHTRSVLTQLGHMAQEIDAMIAENVAGDSWSDRYLPEWSLSGVNAA